MRRRNTSIVFLCLLFRGSHAFRSSQPTGKSPSLAFPNNGRIRKRQVDRVHFPDSNSMLYATPVFKSKTSPASKTLGIEKKVTKLGRAGKTEEALEIFYSIECPSTRLVNCAIDVCARARPPRLEEALSILETGVNKKNLRVNVFTFGSLMNVCNRARNSNKALELLRSFEVSTCIVFLLELSFVVM